MSYLYSDLTDEIISCFYKVYNTLGYGFLEKIYEKSLLLELKNNGLSCEAQKPIKVYYNNEIVGEYFADIVVEDKIILELKASEIMLDQYNCQLINYLKATGIELGLVLNFGKKPEISRKIFTKK